MLEVLSADNWRNDIDRKPALYAELGVREYWTFDPRGIRTDGGPPLEGWRLRRTGNRVPLAPSPHGGFRSEVLGLDLIRSGRLLRFRDPATGEILPDHVESEAMRAAAESRAAAAESRVVATEGRLAEATAAREAAQRRIEELERQLRGSQHR